jgi:tRNA (cmo5U34)-methyltransferase
LPKSANRPHHRVVTSNPFDDPSQADKFADRVEQMVPANRVIHQLTSVLLDEHAPPDANVLILGGGGGLETRALAERHPGWTFDVVDPAAAMLDLAQRTLGPLVSRVRLHEGYIDDAPAGPFAAATSLLTLHFLAADERLRTATEVRRRLAPGAPFVAVHLSFPQDTPDERETWIRRHVTNLVASGVDPADAESIRAAVAADVPALSPEQDRRILQDAGFTDVTEFFAAFTIRGWVGYA